MKNYALPRLYLASRSPRRRALLKKLGIPFRIVSSTYREISPSRGAPAKVAVQHAKGKALGARLGRMASGIIIGADTLIYCRGRITGKSKSLGDARRMLKELSGKIHYVYTGLALYNKETKKLRTSCARSKVVFHALTDKTISDYVRTYRPLDKAGAYAIQEGGHRLIARIQGSLTNVIGLPVELFLKELTGMLRSR